jgi:hypothetical protein
MEVLLQAPTHAAAPGFLTVEALEQIVKWLDGHVAEPAEAAVLARFAKLPYSAGQALDEEGRRRLRSFANRMLQQKPSPVMKQDEHPSMARIYRGDFRVYYDPLDFPNAETAGEITTASGAPLEQTVAWDPTTQTGTPSHVQITAYWLDHTASLMNSCSTFFVASKDVPIDILFVDDNVVFDLKRYANGELLGQWPDQPNPNDVAERCISQAFNLAVALWNERGTGMNPCVFAPDLPTSKLLMCEQVDFGIQHLETRGHFERYLVQQTLAVGDDPLPLLLHIWSAAASAGAISPYKLVLPDYEARRRDWLTANTAEILRPTTSSEPIHDFLEHPQWRFDYRDRPCNVAISGEYCGSDDAFVCSKLTETAPAKHDTQLGPGSYEYWKVDVTGITTACFTLTGAPDPDLDVRLVLLDSSNRIVDYFDLNGAAAISRTIGLANSTRSVSTVIGLFGYFGTNALGLSLHASLAMANPAPDLRFPAVTCIKGCPFAYLNPIDAIHVGTGIESAAQVDVNKVNPLTLKVQNVGTAAADSVKITMSYRSDKNSAWLPAMTGPIRVLIPVGRTHGRFSQIEYGIDYMDTQITVTLSIPAGAVAQGQSTWEYPGPMAFLNHPHPTYDLQAVLVCPSDMTQDDNSVIASVPICGVLCVNTFGS